MTHKLVLTRIFDAPRQLVWDAWTKPEHIDQWWGPRGFDGAGSKVDLRIGGKWHFPMRYEGGAHWAMGFYKEITPIERLVFTDSFSDEEGNLKRASDYGMPVEWPEEVLISVELEDLGDRTRQILTSHFESEEHLALAKQVQMDLGWEESLDKMEEVFDERNLVMSRVVDAPQSLVWQAFSQPEHLAQWWGPEGFTNTFEKFEFREGGEWIFMMHGPDGKDWPNHITFTEIEPESVIAYYHGSPETGPLFKAKITIEPQGDKTMVTLRMSFDTKAARDQKIRDVGAVKGGMQTLGKLVEHVQSMK